MKESPLLFIAAMVRATLDGNKTKTRRPYKVRKHPDAGCEMAASELVREPQHVIDRICPYGQPGDRLWVKETFAAFGRWETRFSAKKGRDEWHFVDMTLECGHAYRFDLDGVSGTRTAGATPIWHIRPSIFMPREASRITLEITGVRVERLQDISEADAMAEGIYSDTAMNGMYTADGDTFTSKVEGPIAAYSTLWEQINGPGSWDANPWVWVIEFKPVAAGAIKEAA